MNSGIPKERRPYEFRAGISPAGVRLLTESGHVCYVERGAGLGAGFSDEDYVRAGARIAYSPEEAWGRAQMILKVTRPTVAELEWVVPGQILMGFLYLAAGHPGKVALLVEKNVTTIAYELIQLQDGSQPVLKPLSQIGGRMALHMAGQALRNDNGGNGVMLGSVPGVAPAEIVIIGGGVAGEHAARAFLGVGAHVTILDRDLTRLQYLAEILPGRLVTLVSHPYNIERACSFADVVVGAVAVPGEKTPIVLTRETLRRMRPGSVFVDVSIDGGGCAETSRPTTHLSPSYVEEGVIHVCVPNLPGVVARTSTHAFLNAAWPYIQRVANAGADEAITLDPALARGVQTHRGVAANLRHVEYVKK